MKWSFVERDDLSLRIPEQYRRVGRNDELSVLVFIQDVVEKNEKRQLALRGNRRCGFVQQEEAVALELEFEKLEKGFSVRASVEAAAAIECTDRCGGWRILFVEFVHVRNGVEEALRPQKVARPG